MFYIKVLVCIFKALIDYTIFIISPLDIDFAMSRQKMGMKKSCNNKNDQKAAISSLFQFFSPTFWTRFISNKNQFNELVQVNLFQKPSLLHQLTHNMTRDCSLNYKKNTSSEHVVYKCCFECQIKKHCTQHVLNLWVNWCKNEGFWKRFTCNQNKKGPEIVVFTNKDILRNPFVRTYCVPLM